MINLCRFQVVVEVGHAEVEVVPVEGDHQLTSKFQLRSGQDGKVY